MERRYCLPEAVLVEAVHLIVESIFDVNADELLILRKRFLTVMTAEWPQPRATGLSLVLPFRVLA